MKSILIVTYAADRLSDDSASCLDLNPAAADCAPIMTDEQG